VVVRNYNSIGNYLGAARYPPYSEKSTRDMNRLLKSRNMAFMRALASPLTLAAIVVYILGIATTLVF